MITIRQQLTRKLLITVGLLIAVSGVAVYACTRAALRAQFDSALHTKAQALTTLTEQKRGKVKIDFSDKQMPSFERGGADFFEVWLANGTPVERSPSLGEAHLPLHYRSQASPAFWNLTLSNGMIVRAIGFEFRPTVDDPKPEAMATDAILVVASNRRNLDRTLFTLALVLTGGGLLSLAATGLVVPRVLRRELSPLQHLAEHAARIDAASLSARFPSGDLPGELAPITVRLNELLARLEDSFERERRFSSDVAHEFRTPIAELRSLAELAIKLPDARLPNADHEILAIALHLESILTRLQTLARGERNQVSTERERVALSPLVEDICQKVQTKAAARRLAFEWQVPSNGEISSDPILLRSIVTNLVDNAVEYTPSGGTVNLKASAEADQFTVQVTNSVDDIGEADLPHLFDRFWRKDSARTNNGHTGLGLSLSRTFAHALGCELTASFIAPGRLALTLTRKNLKGTSSTSQTARE